MLWQRRCRLVNRLAEHQSTAINRRSGLEFNFESTIHMIGASANLDLLIMGGDFNDSPGHPFDEGWGFGRFRIARIIRPCDEVQGHGT